jgi:putative ABC transport system permease protein
LANLKQRKTRSAVSIFGIAIEVMLVLVMVGLVKGTLNDVAARMENVGADILFQPPGSSVIMSLNSVLMKQDYGKMIRAIDGVSSVSPVLTWTTQDIGNRIQVMYGIDKNEFTNVGGKLEIIEGNHLEKPYDLVVDKRVATSYTIKVGQKIHFMNNDFTVSGICKPGIGVRLYVSLETLQNITEQQGKVSFFFIKCASKDKVQPVISNLKDMFKDFKIQNLEGYAEVLSSSAAGVKQFITAVTVLSIVISFLVVLLAMYTAIIERTREIGILKALGATKTYIVTLIMEESLILCVVGVLVGYGLSFLVRYLMAVYMPMTVVEIRTSWMIYAAILGILGGTLGSLYPAFRAARQDPIKALMYE